MKINKMGKINIDDEDKITFEDWDVDFENKYPNSTQAELCSMMLEAYITELRKRMDCFEGTLHLNPTVEQKMWMQWHKTKEIK